MLLKSTCTTMIYVIYVRCLFVPHLPGEGCLILSERMPAISSSSSSSTSCPPRPPPRLRLFHLHFRLANLANSSPSSSPTSQLSAHCWTSTCELPSSVRTAGPQPASCPAQCAPLDLNLGAAQLSVHRWTSTGDLPSSVCTAGPQPGSCPAQCAPLDLNGQI